MIKIFIILLILSAIPLKSDIIYYDINNNKQELSCKDRKIFILDYNFVFCTSCIKSLYKKIKEKYPKSLFIVNLKMSNKPVARVEKETYIKTIIQPDMFIYGFERTGNSKDILIYIKSCNKKRYKESEIFYKNGKLKNITF